MRKASLLISLFIILAVSQSAQNQRRGRTSATRIRSLDDIMNDQLKGKKPQDRRITIPANGGPIVINNVFRNAECSHDEHYVGYKISNEIEYSAGGGGEHFIIIVHGDENALLRSELRFVNLLGISKTAACRLQGDVGGILEYLARPGEDSRYVRNSFSWCRKSS